MTTTTNSTDDPEESSSFPDMGKGYPAMGKLMPLFVRDETSLQNRFSKFKMNSIFQIKCK